MAFLRADLPHLFDGTGIDASAYSPAGVEFRDPITRARAGFGVGWVVWVVGGCGSWGGPAVAHRAVRLRARPPLPRARPPPTFSLPPPPAPAVRLPPRLPLQHRRPENRVLPRIHSARRPPGKGCVARPVAAAGAGVEWVGGRPSRPQPRPATFRTCQCPSGTRQPSSLPPSTPDGPLDADDAVDHDDGPRPALAAAGGRAGPDVHGDERDDGGRPGRDGVGGGGGVEGGPSARTRGLPATPTVSTHHAPNP